MFSVSRTTRRATCPAAGSRIPAPVAGGYKGSPVASTKWPSPVAGGYKTAPFAGGFKGSPVSRSRA